MLFIKRIVLAFAFASLTGLVGAVGVSGSGSGEGGSASGSASGSADDSGSITGGAALEEEESGTRESVQESRNLQEGSESNLMGDGTETQRQAEGSGESEAESEGDSFGEEAESELTE